MQSLRIHKWFFGMSFFLTFIIVGSFIAISLQGTQLVESRKRFQLVAAELKLLLEKGVSEETVGIANENHRKVFELKDRWNDPIRMTKKSATPIECYLGIGRGVEEMKRLALASKVTIKEKCYFGFSKYLGTEKLPLLESMEGLDWQLQVIRVILNILIQSGPKELLFIAREVVEGETNTDGDLFVFSPHLRLNIHDIFLSSAFKVSFVGNTQTLRTFLTKIESTINSIFVRDIEITRCSEDRTESDEKYAVFSIILELLTLKEPMR